MDDVSVELTGGYTIAPLHSSDDIQFWLTFDKLRRSAIEGQEGVWELRDSIFAEEIELLSARQEALSLLQKRQSSEMDLVVSQTSGTRRDSLGQTRADVAALASHHVWEVDELESLWKIKVEKKRNEWRSMFRALVKDVAFGRSIKSSIPENDNIFDNDFLVVCGNRLLIVQIKDEDIFEKSNQLCNTAAIRFTDCSMNFKSIDDLKLIAACTNVSELVWPNLTCQLKIIKDVCVQNNFSLKPGDWLTTRHSNISNDVRVIFHFLDEQNKQINKNRFNDAFNVIDESGFSNIIIQLDSTNHIDAILEGFNGLSQNVKLVRINSKTKFHEEIKASIRKHLPCIVAPTETSGN